MLACIPSYSTVVGRVPFKFVTHAIKLCIFDGPCLIWQAPDNGATCDEPLTTQGAPSWLDFVITGLLGGLALLEGVTILEMSDRWADGEPLGKTLPITLFVAFCVMARVIPRVWSSFSWWRSRRAHRVSQHSHND